MSSEGDPPEDSHGVSVAQTTAKAAAGTELMETDCVLRVSLFLSWPKNHHPLCKPNVYHCVDKCPPLTLARRVKSTPSLPVPLTFILMSLVPLDHPSAVLPSGVPIKIVGAFLISPVSTT